LRERYGERVFKVSLRGGFTCPNRDGTLARGGCAFCSGTALEPVGYDPDHGIAEQLRTGMSYIEQRHGARRFVAYFHDYSATYADADRLRALYQPALEAPEVVALAVSTRPDCLPPEVVAVLRECAEHKDVWIELGLQLADDRVLASLNRGHDVAAFCAAVEVCHKHALPVCAHIILGLADASPEQELRTAALLNELGVWGVKLHAFHVLKNTKMEQRFQAGELRLLSLPEYVERVVDVVERLDPEVVIHRLTAEAPPRLTVAPSWTTNKMACYDAVLDGFVRRQTWQGRRYKDPR